MRLKHLCGSLLLLVFTCCTTSSPADQLKSEMQTVSSWTATTRMVCEAWLKGALPHAYAVDTLQTAEDTLEGQALALQAQSSESDAALRSSVIKEVRGVGQIINGMRAAVERRDNQALALLLKQLEAEEGALKALVGSAGGTRP
jgi:hypothetical protein